MSTKPPHPLHPGESTRLLSILCHPTELEAVLNRPRFSPAHIERARRDKQSDPIDWANFYNTVTLPLARISPVLYPGRDALLASWHALRQVRTLDATTLVHVLVVLLETVPATLPEDAPVVPLPLTSSPGVPKATAAHPRAYQGTTYKPPKPLRPPALDLQPALCQSRERQRLLRHLRPHLPAALAELAALGYSPARLASANQLMARSARPLETGLPDHVSHNSMSPPPLLFLHSLFPSISELPAFDIRAYLAVFHSLSLADDPALRAALGRLVSLRNTPLTRAWCQIVAWFPAQRRSAFVAQLLESGTYQHDPQHVTLEVVDEFNLLTPDTHYNEWVSLLLEAIRKEVSLAYLLSGFRLAVTFHPDARFAIQGDCRDFAYDTVETLILSLPNDYPDAGWYALPLWERCGQLSGFVDVLRQTEWHRFPPTIRRQYASFLINFIQHDVSGAELEKKWRAVKACLPQLEDLIHATPAAYQGRVLGELAGYLWQWDTPEE
ncbi:MAG: hypothetical protein HOP18_15785, partial [Deltaproteobacteria bacterium]|nr:hypothetical protein [Deltaproteobacteria bacterium]